MSTPAIIIYIIPDNMLSNLMKNKGLSQRELARRLGYNSPGVVWNALHGKASIPQDDIPNWADALELQGEERAQFIEWASQTAIPEWYRAELASLRVQLATEREARIAAERTLAEREPAKQTRKIG